jgi:hypothetical protein
MGTKLVCVAWYATDLEAEFARGRLASRSIPSFVTGNAEATQFAIPNAVDHRVRLEVAERDARAALAILEGPTLCPACGAEAFVRRSERPPKARGPRGWFQFLAAPVVKRACTACGHVEAAPDEG